MKDTELLEGVLRQAAKMTFFEGSAVGRVTQATLFFLLQDLSVINITEFFPYLKSCMSIPAVEATAGILIQFFKYGKKFNIVNHLEVFELQNNTRTRSKGLPIYL